MTMADPVFDYTPATVTNTSAFDETNTVSSEDNLLLTDQSHNIIRTMFYTELGPNVRRVNPMPITKQVTIPAGEQFIFLRMGITSSIIRTATMEQCELFTQKENLLLVKFRFADGARFMSVLTHPITIKIQIAEIPGMGTGILIGETRRTEPISFKVNICILDTCTCLHCGSGDVRTASCKPCRDHNTFTRYCSQECQRANRKAHKTVCGR